MSVGAVYPPGTACHPVGDKQHRHEWMGANPLMSQTLKGLQPGAAQPMGVFMNPEKNLKSRATGAVGMCVSRRDMHISIAKGVSGVWCVQHLAEMLCIPSGEHAGRASGEAARFIPLTH